MSSKVWLGPELFGFCLVSTQILPWAEQGIWVDPTFFPVLPDFPQIFVPGDM